MALLFADGFEDGLAGWQASNNANIGTGRFGNGIVAGSANSNIITSFNATFGTMIFGFAVKPGTAACGLCSARADVGIENIYLTRGINGDLVLRGYSGSGGPLLGTAPIGTVPSSAWSYIEVKYNVADNANVVVRVNGQTVITATGDTMYSNNPTASVRIGYIGTDVEIGSVICDDFYLCDTTGSYNNDFLGELMVEHLRPGSDDTAQWTGSDGNSTNNYDLVDEAGAYAGADYVASSTPGQREMYTPVASSRPITSPVLAVMPVAVAMKTDVGTRTAKLVVKEGAGGTLRYGPELGLPTSFGELRAVFDRKGDGSQFTVNDVNALRFGIEVFQ